MFAKRLQGNLQTLEQMQSSMVSVETVTQLEVVIENLRGEMRRLDGTHRNLLVRYAALKSVVESAFAKWEKPKGKTFSALLLIL
jgi:hypothetical protein